MDYFVQFSTNMLSLIGTGRNGVLCTVQYSKLGLICTGSDGVHRTVQHSKVKFDRYW